MPRALAMACCRFSRRLDAAVTARFCLACTVVVVVVVVRCWRQSMVPSSQESKQGVACTEPMARHPAAKVALLDCAGCVEGRSIVGLDEKTKATS